MAMNITDPAIVNRMVLDKVHSRGVLFIVSVALWAGFMAGVVQESLKYLWVRKSSYVGSSQYRSWLWGSRSIHCKLF